jgi:CheY-like chemotaxis protein
MSFPIVHRRARPLALIVDHDDDTRSMYSEYLKQAGCETDEAADGPDALAKAIALRPDVIVTETRLPGINGFELCEILRRDGVTRSIPIIVVTATGDPPSTARARTAGADVVLIKPCLPDALCDEIRRVTHQSRALGGRSQGTQTKFARHLTKSGELLERSPQQRRKFMARAHERRETTTPPVAPPELICPQCDRQLFYRHSNVGGVSAHHTEQWDYYDCSAGCGVFQYRQRTRKLKKA